MNEVALGIFFYKLFKRTDALSPPAGLTRLEKPSQGS